MCAEVWRSCLLNTFTKNFDKPDLSDCLFSIGETKVHCHKVIISLHSPVLGRLLTGRSHQHPQEVDLSFTEHDMSLFRLFIKVLYYGETLLDDENVNTMFGLANKYQVRWLRGRCLNYIAENFSNDEALTLILSGGF